MAAEGTESFVSGTLRTSTKQIHSMLLTWSYTDIRIHKGLLFLVLVFIHFHSTNIIGSVKIAINILQIKRRGVNHCPLKKYVGKAKYN